MDGTEQPEKWGQQGMFIALPAVPVTSLSSNINNKNN